MTDTPVSVPAVANVLEPAVNALITKAVSETQTKLGTAAGQVVAAALPVLWGMGVDELTAFIQTVEAKDGAAALQLLQRKMSLAEIVDQKRTLVNLTAAMAQKQHDNVDLLGSFVLQGLAAAVTALVGL